MELILAAALAVCAVAAAVAAILLLRDGPEKPLRVVALGPRASGKTLLLSSMFASLSRFAPPSQPYLLEAVDTAKAKELLAIDSQLRSAREWPDSTPPGDVREFEFKCVARCDGVKGERLFDIGYLDYGGETLYSARTDLDAALADLQVQVTQAGGLLGIIDGEKVVALLEGDEKRRSGARDYFKTRLAMIEYFLGSARAPFQLVVSKWDIVDRARTATCDSRKSSRRSTSTRR
jgi:hypothetical protein